MDRLLIWICWYIGHQTKRNPTISKDLAFIILTLTLTLSFVPASSPLMFKMNRRPQYQVFGVVMAAAMFVFGVTLKFIVQGDC